MATTKTTPSKPTRIDSAILEEAENAAKLESRSVTQQVNHWARVGMQVAESGNLYSLLTKELNDPTGERLLRSRGETVIAREVMNGVLQKRLMDADFSDAPKGPYDGAFTMLDDDGNLVTIDGEEPAAQ